jgi:hypothetical protein
MTSRRSSRARRLLALAAASALLPAAAAAHSQLAPIAGKKLSIETNAGKPSKSHFTFQSEKGEPALVVAVDHDPRAEGFALLVVGEGGGANRSELIELDAALWKPIGDGADPKGWKYKDKDGTRGGVTQVVLKDGRLKIKAKGELWSFSPGEPQDSIWVHASIEDEWYCAQFGGVVQKNDAGVFKARDAAAPGACPQATEPVCGNAEQEVGEACDDGNLVDDDACANDCASAACEGAEYASTFEAIQDVIFEGYACASALCHGGSAVADSGLELQPRSAGDPDAIMDVNYDALLNAVPPAFFLAEHFVVPGDSKTSLLYQALFKGTHCDQPSPPAECEALMHLPRGMPVGGSLQVQELEAVDLWLRGGAPRDLVVAGTADKLDACLPPADPLKIDPPEPPPAGQGFQLRSSAWDLPSQSENEVCFATYYDLTTLVPESEQFDCPGAFGPNNPSDKCFRWHGQTLVQDPQSHHSIIHIYTGDTSVSDPVWGIWTYKMNDGPADPLHGETCYPQAIDPAKGYNEGCSSGDPPDGEPRRGAACVGFGPGDFQIAAPQFSGSQETYNEIEFADGVYGVLPMSGIIGWNSHAFNLTLGDSTMNQYLNMEFAGSHNLYPARGIFDSSKIFWPVGPTYFSNFLGPWHDVPPFETREFCWTYEIPQGAHLFSLGSHTHRHGVRWRTWEPPNTPCGNFATCAAPTDPGADDRLIYVSTVYNDPVQLDLDPNDPRYIFDEPAAEDRTFKFCSLYDNGATPDSPPVKRQSTSPVPPDVFGLIVGGPCEDSQLACINSNPASSTYGQACGAQPEAARDAFCDSSTGAGDGACDACPLRGGFATEDEMLILLGTYYVP